MKIPRSVAAMFRIHDIGEKSSTHTRFIICRITPNNPFITRIDLSFLDTSFLTSYERVVTRVLLGRALNGRAAVYVGAVGYDDFTRLVRGKWWGNAGVVKGRKVGPGR